MIRFIILATFVCLFLVLSTPLMLVEWIIGKFNMDIKSRSSLAIVNWAFRCIAFLSGTKVITLGEENVPKDTAVLYVGNHRSFFDIILTYPRVPRLTGYVAKKEIKDENLSLPQYMVKGFNFFKVFDCNPYTVKKEELLVEIRELAFSISETVSAKIRIIGRKYEKE